MQQLYDLLEAKVWEGLVFMHNGIHFLMDLQQLK